MKEEAEISERVSNDSSLEDYLLQECVESVNKDLENNELFNSIIEATLKVNENHPKAVWVEGESYLLFFASKTKLNKVLKEYKNENNEGDYE